MFDCQMVAQGLQVAAVQVAHPAAALAPQQKTAVGRRRVGAVLVQRALPGLDAVEEPGGLQLFQLAVDGGKAHRTARPAQFLRHFAGGQGVAGPVLQALENGPALFGGIGHMGRSFFKLRIIFIL